MLKIKLLILVLVMIASESWCQVGIGTTAPASSSLLELKSTNKGLLIPRLSVAQRNSMTGLVAGLLIYNTDCNNLNFYNGITWVSYPNTSIPNPGTVSGYKGVCNNQSGVVYAITPVPNATSYVWSVPTGASVTAGQGTTTATVTFGSTSGSVCVAASTACETSIPACAAVSVISTAPAQPGTITESCCNGNICELSEGVTYSIAEVTGASYYTWTVPSDWTIVSGQGTTMITVNVGYTNGNVTVTANNGCGASTLRSVSITVSHPPNC